MVAEKKKTSGQSKEAAPQPPPEPPAGTPAGEKTGGPEQQGKPSEEGGTTTKRKPWIKKTPVERILEEVQKQEEKVAALKKELEKEEAALKTMRDATKLLGGS